MSFKFALEQKQDIVPDYRNGEEESGSECKENGEQVTPCNWGSLLAGGTCRVFFALQLMINLSNVYHPWGLEVRS